MSMLANETRDLGRAPAFRRYFTAVIVSTIGSSATLAIVPLIVLDETGSPALTAFAATLAYFPFLFFGLLAGALADRMDRRRIMVMSDVVSAIAVLTPFALAQTDLGLAGSVVIARLAMSTADVWFGAANFGSLPHIVGDRARLVNATTLMTTATTAIGLVIPAAAVAVMHLIGPFSLLAFNALTFLIAAYLRWRIPEVSATGHVGEPLGRALRHSGADIAVGIRYLFGDRVIRTVTLAGVFGATASGAVISLISVYAADAFRIPADDPRQGVFLSAAALGVIALSWVLPLLHRRTTPLGVLLVLQITACLTGIVLAVVPNVWIAVVVYGLFNAWSTLLITNGITLRMQLLPDELQGRVGSAGRLIAWAGTPVGGVLGGLLAQSWPIRLVFAGTTIVWLISIVAVIVVILRSRSRS